MMWLWRFNLCFISGCLLLTACAGELRAAPADELFVKGHPAQHLYVVSEASLRTSAEQMLFATLQGLVARNSDRQIYFQSRSSDLWREDLQTRHGLTHETVLDPWRLLKLCRDSVDGYILFDLARPDSSNAANSLCGPLRAIAVDQSLEEKVRAAGLTNRVLDLRDLNEQWVHDHYAARFSPRLIVEQKESLTLALRDYATLANAFVFYAGNSGARSNFLGHLTPDAACLGWGDAAKGEEKFIGPSSRAGVFTVPADHARNLSTLSGVREANLQQRIGPAPRLATNAHYVCFLVTDGDNVQWNLGGLPAYFNQSARGSFSMGWALAPSLVDLAPSVLHWYYEHAIPGRDGFVAGPSGGGYFYPSLFPPAQLDEHTRRLNDFMQRGDLRIVQILDFNSLDRLDLWDKYTVQPGIDALFYLEYSRHDRHQGTIRWSNAKPVITPRALLWRGLKGADEEAVTATLNAAPRHPNASEGYSLVLVHAWTKGLADVQKVVAGLNPGVEVVTPDQFVKLIRSNLGPKL